MVQMRKIKETVSLKLCSLDVIFQVDYLKNKHNIILNFFFQIFRNISKRKFLRKKDF